MSVQITCIKKSNGYHADPHHAIESLGWTNPDAGTSGRSSRLEMYDYIKNKNGQAFVKDSYGNVAYVGALENQHGTKYVQTYADGKWTDNLLALNECS